MTEKNRKTTIPVKNSPNIVEWLLKNCTKDELILMNSLASNRKTFTLLNSIFTRLTDYNIHQVFYDNFRSAEELQLVRAAKRGEVAGLKAFSYACQKAIDQLRSRKGDE